MVRRTVIILLVLLPLAAMGQTPKSEALFEQAVEKSVVGQYEEYVIASDTYALVTK